VDPLQVSGLDLEYQLLLFTILQEFGLILVILLILSLRVVLL
jgi:hypothetical protein